ncbi:MAG: Outer membrane pore protein E [Candidatus Erwinia impunctatus]|nr:Outer membrane pore protein E [Culicoides impunctatus]
MMKSTLAIVVSTLLLSTAAQAAEVYNKDGNKLDFYGRARGLHYFSDYAKQNGDQSYARLGFKGQTQINDLITGYGQWEYEFRADGAESEGSKSNKTRLGFAGLKFAQYGSFDYGRNFGVLYDALAWTDMFPEFGGDSVARTDNFMTKRTTGVATYRNNNFFGLVDGWKFALQYQGKNDSTSANSRSDAARQNGDGFGLSSSCAFGKSGISAAAAYTNSDRTNTQTLQTFGKGSKAEAWATSLKYDANKVYLAAMYSETRNMTPISGTARVNNSSVSVSGAANKAQGIELVAQYQFDFGLRPSLGYVQTKGKDLENGVGDADLVKYFDVGMTYYFNKNMNTYVDYKINQLSDNNKLGLNSDDVVAVGLTYQF